MATSLIKEQNDQVVLFEDKKGVRKVILNRPKQLNCLTYEMFCQMLKKLGDYEEDPNTRLVILKGNGRAFCAGGDVKSVLSFMTTGHWSFGASFYRKQLNLDYKIGTYKKPVVSIIDGIVMGGGAGLSLNSTFRIVTENTVFAMPEAAIGLFPDCSASHFLSRLPGFLGEYLGLTGSRLDGAEMVKCGLATHFVLSKDLASMENALDSLAASGSVDLSSISKTIHKFVHGPHLKKDSVYKRLDAINECFSKDTAEEMLSSLEELAAKNEEKWIVHAIKSMTSVSPTSLKIFLRLIREGRMLNLKECLVREFRASCHILRRTVNNDFYEGGRALLVEKGRQPQWMPSKLDLVSDEMVGKYFCEVDNDDDWEPLHLPPRPAPAYFAPSRL
ncbi:probable 3-hydroxyisobutyryl-CoA hydrolase 3 [Coffea eugenioides]|uniref:probable 3-hydroxyisobutyryl-CoA hydrolase 3 n=1 Tax=Coffea eugenioides TaxID=49369 RepID=UPI000F60DF46|nr:probable 3-hydroxyisobutyryl-CoA hydrolase 3 [Coffea eugenioides]